MTYLLHTALTRSQFRQISKTKYLYKNKYLSFRKFAVLESATLLKIIFNSVNFPHFLKTH